jgi:hypothetical protein
MGWVGWNQKGTAIAHDVLHLSSDGSQLQLQGSMKSDAVMATGKHGRAAA